MQLSFNKKNTKLVFMKNVNNNFLLVEFSINVANILQKTKLVPFFQVRRG